MSRCTKKVKRKHLSACKHRIGHRRLHKMTPVDRDLFRSPGADLVHPSVHFLLVILDQVVSAFGAFQLLLENSKLFLGQMGHVNS